MFVILKVTFGRLQNASPFAEHFSVSCERFPATVYFQCLILLNHRVGSVPMMARRAISR